MSTHLLRRSRPRAALAAGALTVAMAGTTAATAGPAAAACEESTYRDYTLSGQAWATINAQQQFAAGTSGSHSVTSTLTTSKTRSVSGTVGASADLQLAEINAQVSTDYARTVTITKSQTTTVNVPSRSYEQVATFGIWHVKYYVTATRVTPSCARTPAGSGYLHVYRPRAALTRA